MRILVTDDQADILMLIQLALTDYGCDVDVAREGRQALILAQNQAYDLILLDLMMPDLDGHATLNMLRRNPIHSKTPIVAVTAKALRGDEQHLIKSGFDGLLFKPFMVDQLIDFIAQYCPEP